MAANTYPNSVKGRKLGKRKLILNDKSHSTYILTSP